jgi:hypothetical protein
VTLADALFLCVEYNSSVRATAERLGVHLNTLNNRFERLADLRGIESCDPHLPLSQRGGELDAIPVGSLPGVGLRLT